VETAQNPKPIQAKNLLTNDKPMETANSFNPNQNKPITKKPTRNLPKAISLSSQNPNQSLTLKTLPVTNATSCKINSKLHELQIDEDTINQIQNLYIEATDTNPSLSDNSEEEFQIDEIVTSSATSDTSTDSKQVNVLTQDQEFILKAIKRIDDSQLQKTYLDKLLKDFSKPEHLPSNPPNRSVVPSTSTNTHELTKILNKRKSKTTVTVSELHSEIKTLKSELQSLKQAQQKDSAILQHLLSKIES